MPNIMQDLGTKIGSEFKTHRLRIEAVETDKQENLVSGTNIKTINGTSVLGSGDIVTTQTTISGNAGTATKLQTARNIALTGDVTGNANFDGSGNISITAAIAANSVALGTDTTGNYVAGNTAGTGITVTGTAGEGWSPTITLSNVGTAGTYTKITTNAQGQVTSGSTLTNSDIPSLDASKITSGTIDPARLPSFVDDVLEFANLAGFPTTGEAGKIYIALDTNKSYRWSGSTYVYITSGGGAVDSVNGMTGVVNVTAISGNSGTATALQTTRTFSATGDVTATAQNFNGSANVVLPLVLANSGVTAGSYAKVTVDAKGRITGSATPTMEDIPDATFKRSVRAATTANITLSATQTIDGTALVAGDRVLVKDQTTTSQNGIYVVAAGAWTRALDADTSSKIASALVAVDSGTANGGKLFDNDFKTTDTLGTTAMLWSSNLDSGSLSSTTPLVAGTAAIGTGTTVARADHVHPAQTAITGNAGTATTLQTARTISGVSFNGSANINIEDRLGTAIASAATTTVGTVGLGDYMHITGTTTITSLGTAGAAGIRRTLIFDGALTLTHNATSLICPGDANIVTVAGTVIEVVAESTANWRVVSVTHPSIGMAELGYLDGVTSAIQTQINTKAPLASPALTGVPTAPTAEATNSSTQLATTAFAVPRTSTTGSARLPVGSTAQRDASPVDGMIRYNSTTMGFEGYFNGQWQSVGGGQMFGNALVKAVSYNAQVIDENLVVKSGTNAWSVGDITLNDGCSITVEDNAVYKII